MRRLLTVLAALCLLAVPPAALAQNAGDEQYADPFGQVEKPDRPQEQPAETPAAAPPPAPAPATAQAQSGAALGDSQAEVAQQTSAPTLPATGFPAVLVAVAGGLLLASGATIRRRVS
jgi:LPXTG-motif cell wall-anchored protein